MSYSPPDSLRELLPHIDKQIEAESELWHLWRRACADSLFFFSKVVVCSNIPQTENIMTWRTHGPMCLLLEEESCRRVLIEFPRRMLKSTIATVSTPVHRLINKVVRGDDPSDRFGILAHSWKVGQRHWWDIKSIFDNNRLFQFLFPDLLPGDRWNEEYGSVIRRLNRKEPTVEPLSLKSAGKHYDQIFCDDLINEENWDEPEAVQKALMLFRQTRNLLEAPDSRVVVVGNRWGLADLNATIHQEAEATGFSVLSVNSEVGPNEDGPYRCRNLPENVQEALEEVRSLADTRGTIWPERFTRKQLRALRVELGVATYAAQMLNQPDDPEAMEFDISLVGRVRLAYDQQMGPFIKHLETGEIVPLSSCNLYVTWDPALDEKRSRSDNAIVVTAFDTQNRAYVLQEHARKEDPFASMSKYLAYCRRWSGYLQASGMEEVLFQKILKRNLKEMAQKRNVSLLMKPVKTPTGKSKDQRIRAWISHHIEKSNLFIEENCTKTYDQLRLFGVEGSKRDLIDALAYATQLWRRPLSEIEAFDEEVEEAWQIQQMGITGYGQMPGYAA